MRRSTVILSRAASRLPAAPGAQTTDHAARHAYHHQNNNGITERSSQNRHNRSPPFTAIDGKGGDKDTHSVLFFLLAFLPIAGQLIILIPIQVALTGQRPPEMGSPAVEADLDGINTQVKDLGDLGV